MKKRLAIMGSTGSIGTQTLEIVDQFPDLFEVVSLSAKRNLELLETQMLKYHPKQVSLFDESQAERLAEKYPSQNVEGGLSGLENAVTREDVDIVVMGIMGFAALAPTLEAVKKGKTIALANKESIITAGNLLKDEIAKTNCTVIPVDSEHNALYQLLLGQERTQIETIVLTASGGPFYRQAGLDFDTVTPEQAVKHPNWSMGAKISVDSATLMNKGLEMIEAHILFDYPSEKIEVWVHPQSIVHGAIWFKDNSCIAQLNKPNMKCSIGYVLSYPERLDSVIEKMSFKDMAKLEFLEPDEKRFPCLRLAREALVAGPSHCITLNALNELAVNAFLEKRIRFSQIPQFVEAGLATHRTQKVEDLASVFRIDEEARSSEQALVAKLAP